MGLQSLQAKLRQRHKHEMGEDEKYNIFEQLTPRQMQVFKLVGDGKTSGEIAERLCITEKTVQNHRSNIAAVLDLEGYGSLYYLAAQIRLKKQDNENT